MNILDFISFLVIIGGIICIIRIHVQAFLIRKSVPITYCGILCYDDKKRLVAWCIFKYKPFFAINEYKPSLSKWEPYEISPSIKDDAYQICCQIYNDARYITSYFSMVDSFFRREKSSKRLDSITNLLRRPKREFYYDSYIFLKEKTLEEIHTQILIESM